MRSLGLRARLLVIGLAGVSAGLAIGGIVLVVVLQLAVQKTVDAGALQTGRTIARLVDTGQLPVPFPQVGAQVAVVQVVDAQARVRAGSSGSDQLVSLLDGRELAAVRSGEALFVRGDRGGVDGPLRVIGVPAGTRADPLTVVVAAPVAQLESSSRLLRGALLILFPLLVASLGLVAWWVIGKTLRPVEALRRGAEEITGAGTATLLPIPGPQDEIHRLAVTLNDMLARLETSRRRQRAFVADAAHELRSPLASMRTQLEVAQHLGSQTDWPATASDLLIDLDRLTRLTSDLLLLARTDDPAPPPVSPEPVDLSALVTELAGRYSDARVVPATRADAPVWTGGDPDAIRRIVANLLDNAIRHASSAVTVAVFGDGADAVVTVTDDGAGIPGADRERVFGRFTRLDDARDRDAGGSGLGLAIVRELARRHHGRVRLLDAAPGVRAEVRLPAISAGG